MMHHSIICYIVHWQQKRMNSIDIRITHNHHPLHLTLSFLRDRLFFIFFVCLLAILANRTVVLIVFSPPFSIYLSIHRSVFVEPFSHPHKNQAVCWLRNSHPAVVENPKDDGFVGRPIGSKPQRHCYRVVKKANNARQKMGYRRRRAVGFCYC